MGFPGGSDGKESAWNAGDLGWKDPLEKEMATQFSILAWRIPWTEKPGGLQSMGLQRVGHDWATNTFTWKLAKAHPKNWSTYCLYPGPPRTPAGLHPCTSLYCDRGSFILNYSIIFIHNSTNTLYCLMYAFVYLAVSFCLFVYLKVCFMTCPRACKLHAICLVFHSFPSISSRSRARAQ